MHHQIAKGVQSTEGIRVPAPGAHPAAARAHITGEYPGQKDTPSRALKQDDFSSIRDSGQEHGLHLRVSLQIPTLSFPGAATLVLCSRLCVYVLT